MKHENVNKIALFAILIFGLIQLFNSVLIFSPEQEILDRKPVFKWYGNYDHYRLIVDDDKTFSNPIVDVIVESREYSLNENLDTGKYYWKVIGYSNEKQTNSLTGNFVIKSYVGYSLEDNNLVNVGNVISKLTGPTGYVILDLNENKKLTEGAYKIEQDE